MGEWVIKNPFLESSFLRFIIVGGLGLITSLTIFYSLADILKVDPSISAVIAFCPAVTQNFLLNHYWSFAKVVNYPASLRGFFKYVGIYLLGLCINVLVLNLALVIFHPDLKVIAQFIGTLSSMIFDFFGIKLLVFLPNRNQATVTKFGENVLKFIYRIVARLYLKNPFMADWIFEKYQRPINFFKMLMNQTCFLLKINYAPFLLGATIDVTSKCNLHCRFCRGQYPELETKTEVMPFQRYKAILSRLPHSIESILLSNIGEPMLHPQIFEIIDYTSRAGFRPVVFTNGTLLTEDVCSTLLSSHLYSLNISLETDPENCLNIRGTDLGEIENNVNRLLDLKKRIETSVKINLSLVVHKGNAKKVPDFLTKWASAVDEVKISPVQLNEKNENPILCSELWRGNINVRPDGSISPCCADFVGELIIGTVFKTDLLTIWRGPKMHNLRATVIRHEFPYKCRNCRWENIMGLGRIGKLK